MRLGLGNLGSYATAWFRRYRTWGQPVAAARSAAISTFDREQLVKGHSDLETRRGSLACAICQQKWDLPVESAMCQFLELISRAEMGWVNKSHLYENQIATVGWNC
jgi:hypothetical protein